MKTALVTGANKGIGLEIARQLAAKDIEVILSARNSDLGMAAYLDVKSEGGKVHFVQLDVSDKKSVHKAVESAKEMVGQLDILINNAAILLDGGRDFLRLSEEEIRLTMEINAFGPLWIARAFLPLMKEGGRMVNISSGAGAVCGGMGTYEPMYSISKASLNAITMQLAHALKHKNILVNAVCPGWVKTDMGGASAPKTTSQGADTPVWMAIHPGFNKTGKFFRDRKEISW